MSVETRVFSDHAMQDPTSYYGGFKEPRIKDFGTWERSASDPVTGEMQFVSGTVQVIDHDRSIRREQADPSVYWTEPLTIRMVSRPVRAAQGTPFTVITGPLLDAQASGDSLEYTLTIGDIVNRTLLPDEARVPWRTIGDGMLTQLATVAEGLDRSWREPIIYGKHYRVVDVDEPSPEGFIYAPIYLGIQTLGGGDHHCWMVCGHAVAAIDDLFVKRTADDGTVSYESQIASEGTTWLVPHHAGFTAEFGAAYVDYPSSAYGDMRRYTLVYGKVGEVDPDLCAKGETQLLLRVDGVEDVGDGSGDVILDAFDQYLHFMQNYCANAGRQSYQSGAYLSTPSWYTQSGTIPVLDEASFADCKTIGQTRLPEFPESGYPAGYMRAFVIGAQGDAPSLRATVAQFNVCCDCQSAVDHTGSFYIFMLSPTDAIKASARVYRDVTDILKGGFGTRTQWGSHENVVPFRADFHTGTNGWRTTGKATWTPSVTNWAREIVGQTREFKFVPGITHSFHIARLASIRGQNPPRMVTLEGVVGPMALLEPGDYINVDHFAAVGEPGSPRLCQVQSVAISPTPRTVRIVARDCEDLIGYDEYLFPQPDEGDDEETLNVGDPQVETPPEFGPGPFGPF